MAIADLPRLAIDTYAEDCCSSHTKVVCQYTKAGAALPVYAFEDDLELSSYQVSYGPIPFPGSCNTRLSEI